MKERLQPVPDLVLERLTREGVDTVFGITGGMIAVQLDAFTRTDKINFVAVQHEQAAAMAAEAYARLHPSKLGVAMTTSGPGGTNLITGMYGCWFDSIPSLFITGQVGTFDSKGDSGLRQKGFQEADMVATMKPFTKFSRLRFIWEAAVRNRRSMMPIIIFMSWSRQRQALHHNLSGC